MSSVRDRFRDEQLDAALDGAIRGDRATLYDKLRRASGLPGVRVNSGLVRAFAAEAARRGATIDPLLTAMVSLHEDVAPYGHVDEILPILGAAGLCARAAADGKARDKLLEQLQDVACDRRFRVRDEVATGLVAMGVAVGAAFADSLRAWIEDDEPYLARAVVVALTDTDLLSELGLPAVTELLDAALTRITSEHRAGRRHEAYRELHRAMHATPAAILARFPKAVVAIERAATNEDIELREVIEETTTRMKKLGMVEKVESVRAALDASENKRPDPRHDRLPGKRGRGKR
jgi:hypothetical protein